MDQGKIIEKAGICSCIIGLINVLIHCMVIFSILPFTWVNGGRTATLEAATSLSFNSIAMTLFNILIVLIASQIIPVKLNKFWGIALSVFLIVTLPMSLMGIVQQFMGTTFEKCIMSLVTIVGFCADTRIAFEKRW